MSVFNTKTVLLIDDDPSWLAFMVQAMTNPKIHLLTCSNSDLAIDIAIRNKVDLLVTDTNMPKFDGIQILAKVRSNPTLSSLPVIIFFSGLQGSDMTREDLYKRGATAVFKKTDVLDFFWFLEEFARRT